MAEVQGRCDDRFGALREALMVLELRSLPRDRRALDIGETRQDRLL